MARNIDIAPTILDILGVGSLENFQGRSLLALIDSGGAWDVGDPETYSETYLSATDAFASAVEIEGKEIKLGFRRQGVRTPEWMFIRNEPWPLVDESDPLPITESLRGRFTSEELYNTAADPRQEVDLSARRPDVADRLRGRLEEYLALEAGHPEYRQLDEKSLEKLRALGYVE